MSCPVLDPEEFNKNLEKLSQIYNEDIKSQLDKIASEPCPMDGGKRRGRKMKGGDIFSRRNIKVMIYALIIICMSLAGISRTGAQIGTGVSMLLNGECGQMQNRLWSLIGWENPVCRTYNRLLTAVISAIAGDNEARLMLTGLVTSIIGFPVATAYSIDNLAARIENAVRGNFQAIQNAPAGGRRTKRRSSRGKRRHSRCKRTRRH